MQDLRGDNQGKVVFDTSPLVAQTTAPYNFGPFRHDVNGNQPIPGGLTPTNHALIATVTNQAGTETGFSMKGMLSVRKGYLGACKTLY